MPVSPGLRQKNQEFKVMFDCLANAGVTVCSEALGGGAQLEPSGDGS